MKKFKALLKSRRGVAIEFAIGVMFITVAVSTILLSTAIHEINARKRDNDSFSEKLAVEQYAEEVLYNAKTAVDLAVQGISTDKIKIDKDSKFVNSCKKLDNGIEIHIFDADDEVNGELLVITYVKTPENKYQITSWTWQ